MKGAGRKINMRKWTPDIIAWMESQCPLKDHGYKSVLEFTNVMNEKFGTDFSYYAVKHQACILKIQASGIAFNKKRFCENQSC